MGIVSSVRVFIYLFIYFFRNYMCAHLRGKKYQRGWSSRGISQRIRHWANTARCRTVVGLLLRGMPVCFQKDGCVYGVYASIWACRKCLAWRSCQLSCCPDDVWGRGQRCTDPPCFFFLISCNQTTFYGRNEKQNLVSSTGKETKHCGEATVNGTHYSQLSTNWAIHQFLFHEAEMEDLGQSRTGYIRPTHLLEVPYLI